MFEPGPRSEPKSEKRGSEGAEALTIQLLSLRLLLSLYHHHHRLLLEILSRAMCQWLLVVGVSNADYIA